MDVNDVERAKRVAAREIEPHILSFLGEYNQRFQNSKIKTFPYDLRNVLPHASDESLVRITYPYTGREAYGANDGIPIHYYSDIQGEYLYLGNFSLDFSYSLGVDPAITEYCFKYWYSKNSYSLHTDHALSNIPICFNFHFDWDRRHSEEDLEFHTTFLHTLPRVKSHQMDTESFFDYLRKFILPITKKIANGDEEHIALVNRIY